MLLSEIKNMILNDMGVHTLCMYARIQMYILQKNSEFNKPDEDYEYYFWNDVLKQYDYELQGSEREISVKL